MILDFADKTTEMLAAGRAVKGLPADLQNRAFNKLAQIDSATTLSYLRIPPSNRLEKLSGNLSGFWSIRVNAQWRIVFRWHDGNASDVKFLDYH